MLLKDVSGGQQRIIIDCRLVDGDVTAKYACLQRPSHLTAMTAPARETRQIAVRFVHVQTRTICPGLRGLLSPTNIPLW